ncbi:T9SS type A sorting domain-containing protein [bacterium]|nr:T9SS type A sorting domain-containing protein [bacterium]
MKNSGYYNTILKMLIFVINLYSAFFGANKLFSQGVSISWNANTEPDLDGYCVYYGQSSHFFTYRVDVGRDTSYTIASLPDTGIFYFAVTAYDFSGNESIYSEKVTLHVKKTAGKDRYFSLESNYPNPFNPNTRIPYLLPERLYIKLAIYDLLGREVKRLEEGEKDAGEYEAFWDGKDEYGIRVANGIYFCRLWVGDYSKTKKLIMTQ